MEAPGGEGDRGERGGFWSGAIRKGKTSQEAVESELAFALPLIRLPRRAVAPKPCGCGRKFGRPPHAEVRRDVALPILRWKALEEGGRAAIADAAALSTSSLNAAVRITASCSNHRTSRSQSSVMTRRGNTSRSNSTAARCPKASIRCWEASCESSPSTTSRRRRSPRRRRPTDQVWRGRPCPRSPPEKPRPSSPTAGRPATRDSRRVN